MRREWRHRTPARSRNHEDHRSRERDLQHALSLPRGSRLHGVSGAGPGRRHPQIAVRTGGLRRNLGVARRRRALDGFRRTPDDALRADASDVLPLRPRHHPRRYGDPAVRLASLQLWALGVHGAMAAAPPRYPDPLHGDRQGGARNLDRDLVRRRSVGDRARRCLLRGRQSAGRRRHPPHLRGREPRSAHESSAPTTSTSTARPASVDISPT